MRVVEIDGDRARCEVKGVERTVSLFLLKDEPLTEGDVVMVHVGYAIQKMSEDDARTTWELFDEALAAEERRATTEQRSAAAEERRATTEHCPATTEHRPAAAGQRAASGARRGSAASSSSGGSADA
jgi:hydrogenase expression/formation protein HypC